MTSTECEVTYEGKTYTYPYTENPYPTHFIGRTPTGWDLQGDFYRVDGEDQDGNEVIILWTIKNPDAEDGADACDWDNPAWVL